MAPEAICGDEQGPSSDVYAFAVFMYVLYNPNPEFESGKGLRISPFTLARSVVNGRRYRRPDEIMDAV
jgi:hypothetical protein